MQGLIFSAIESQIPQEAKNQYHELQKHRKPTVNPEPAPVIVEPIVPEPIPEPEPTPEPTPVPTSEPVPEPTPEPVDTYKVDPWGADDEEEEEVEE